MTLNTKRTSISTSAAELKVQPCAAICQKLKIERWAFCALCFGWGFLLVVFEIVVRYLGEFGFSFVPENFRSDVFRNDLRLSMVTGLGVGILVNWWRWREISQRRRGQTFKS